MTKYNILIYIIFILLKFKYSNAKLPHILGCGDEKCRNAISLGVTTQRYSSPEKGVLSFPVDAEVVVYGKGVSSELWAVQILGKTGFVPKRFIREMKILVHNRDLIEVDFSADKKVKNSHHNDIETNRERAYEDQTPDEYNDTEEDEDYHNHHHNRDERYPSEDSREKIKNDASFEENRNEHAEVISDKDHDDSFKVQNEKVVNTPHHTNNEKVSDSFKNVNPDGTYKPDENLDDTFNHKTDTNMVDTSHHKPDENIVDISHKPDENMVDMSQANGKKSSKSFNHLNTENTNKADKNMDGKSHHINNEETPEGNSIKHLNGDDSYKSDEIMVDTSYHSNSEKSLNPFNNLNADHTNEANENMVDKSHDINNEDMPVSNDQPSADHSDRADEKNNNIIDTPSPTNSEEPSNSFDGNIKNELELDGAELPKNVNDFLESKGAEHSLQSIINESDKSFEDKKLDQRDIEQVSADLQMESSQIIHVNPAPLSDVPEQHIITGEDVEYGELKMITSPEENDKVENSGSVPLATEFSSEVNKELDASGTENSDPIDSITNDAVNIGTDSFSNEKNVPIESENPFPNTAAAENLVNEVNVKQFEVYEGTTILSDPNSLSSTTAEPISTDSPDQLQASHPMNNEAEQIATDPLLSDLPTKSDNEAESLDPVTLKPEVITESEHVNLHSSAEDTSDSPSQNQRLKTEEIINIGKLVFSSGEDESTSAAQEKNEITLDDIVKDVKSKVSLELQESDEALHINNGFTLLKPESILNDNAIPSISEEENSQAVSDSTTSSDVYSHSDESLNTKDSESLNLPDDNLVQSNDVHFRDLPFADPNSEIDEASNTVNNSTEIQFSSFSTIPEDIAQESGGVKETDIEGPEAEEKGFISVLTKQFFAYTNLFINDGMSLAIEAEIANPHLSTGTLNFLLIVAVTIVSVYVLHMVVVKMSREAPLLKAMNELSREYRLLKEDNLTLKKQVANENGQIKSETKLENLKQNEALVIELEKCQKEHKTETEEMTDRIQQLEQELEEVTANGLEMHRMLDELLTEQKEASNFQASVDSLQYMLDGQKEKVESLTSDLAIKTRLNDELQLELKAKGEKLSKLDNQLDQLSYSLEEMKQGRQEAVTKYEKDHSDLLSLNDDMTKLKGEFKTLQDEKNSLENLVTQLKEKEKKLKQAVAAKEAELKVSKECLKKMKINLKDGSSMDKFFNAIQVKAQLASVEEEKLCLEEQLEEVSSNQKKLAQSILTLKEELKTQAETREEAVKEKNEANAKLEILTNYFKEKEAEYTKELESQEGLRLGAEGTASAIANKMQNCKSELSSLRSQVETLKTELEDQKQSYKMQLNNEEKKATDNWLACRAAERRQEELRQENSQLRQRLTSLQQEKADNLLLKQTPNRFEANGSASSSLEGQLDRHPTTPPLDGHLPPLPPMLPHMFPGGPPLPPGLHHPPPPHHFLGPLPPPPPLPDRRLPPAGRIASPPFRRRGSYERRSYSPSSDHSHYSDHYSPSGRYSPDRSRHFNTSRTSRDGSPPPPVGDNDRWYNRSPDGNRQPKNYYYADDISDYRRSSDMSAKGLKTSTPLGPNDR